MQHPEKPISMQSASSGTGGYTGAGRVRPLLVTKGLSVYKVFTLRYVDVAFPCSYVHALLTIGNGDGESRDESHRLLDV